jgi:hypothetical protein
MYDDLLVPPLGLLNVGGGGNACLTGDAIDLPMV